MEQKPGEKKETTMGARIRICRYNSGKTQTEFARSLGITQSTLSKYENDSMVVSPDILAALVQMGWSSDWLLMGREEPGMKIEISEAPKEKSSLGRKQGEVVSKVKKLSEKQLDLVNTLLDQFAKKE